MAAIVTRETSGYGATVKNALLTNQEIDNNFINLNTDISTRISNSPVGYSFRPSLILDFSNSKVVDPRITFVRASTARYYDGRTLTKAEENLLNFSTDISNALWIKSNITQSLDTAVVPVFSNTAYNMYETITNGIHQLYQSIQIAINSYYTLSVLVKWLPLCTRKLLLFPLGSSSVGNTRGGAFDSNGVYTASSSGTGVDCTNATAISMGNGWWKLSLTAYSTIAGTGTPGIRLCISESNDSYAGDTNQGVLIGGIQLEQSNGPTIFAPITTYIPTLKTANNNIPVIESDPSTGECLGLRIESGATNNFLYSQDFVNPYWNYNSNVTVNNNVAIAPDGTRTAAKIIANSGSAVHKFGRNTAGTSSTNRVYSFYVKYAGKKYINLGTSSISTYNVTFDLELGTFIAPTAGIVGLPTMLNVGNGWWRISHTTATGTVPFINLLDSYVAANDTTTSTGDDFSGIYIWGAQWENSTTNLTSYIYTNGATATRSADSAIMNDISWLRKDEGTLYTENIYQVLCHNIYAVSYETMAELGTGGGNGTSIYCYNGIHLFSATRINSTYVENIAGSPTYPVKSIIKAAKAFKTNSIVLAGNGVILGSNTSCLLPAMDKLYIGYSAIQSLYLNGYIRRVVFYPKKLSDSDLQILTS